MKILSLLSIAVVFCVSSVFADETFKDDQAKLGYAIGMSIGLNLKQNQIEVDAEQLAAGLKASFTGAETQISVEEMQQILVAYQQEMQMKQVAKQAAEAADNLSKAEAFLVENGKQEGVETLESGLQYKVLSAGSGASPQESSKVEVHYRGTLIDGTEFDSSYKRGEPASFPVNGVIPGWTEALQLMKEGDKWQLAIPPALAYGEQGAPPVIPANSALVFEVELLKVLE